MCGMNMYMEYLDDTKISVFLNNGYFSGLTKGISHVAFIESQIPFINAVRYWLDILTIYMNLLDNPDHKSLIMENINDESGGQQDIKHIDKCHINTYHDYLKKIGMSHNINPYDPQHDHQNIVNNFINRLDNIRGDRIKLGSALCAIEYIYTYVSKYLSEYLKLHSEWLNGQQHHYELHETLDIKHANDLFITVMTHNMGHNESPECDEIRDGLEYGYTIFYELYQALGNHYFTTPHQNSI